jgi:hypothetical protein
VTSVIALVILQDITMGCNNIDTVYACYTLRADHTLWHSPVIFNDYSNALEYRDEKNRTCYNIREVFLFEDIAMVTSCLIAEPTASEKW